MVGATACKYQQKEEINKEVIPPPILLLAAAAASLASIIQYVLQSARSLPHFAQDNTCHHQHAPAATRFLALKKTSSRNRRKSPSSSCLEVLLSLVSILVRQNLSPRQMLGFDE
jgi:hypothetical protein